MGEMILTPADTPSISVLYYPAYDIGGTVMLEIGSECYIPKKCRTREEPKLLELLKDRAKTGKGLPFYRFVFNGTDGQAKIAKSLALDGIGTQICSVDVAHFLSKAGVYKTPLMFRVTPLLLATHLFRQRKIGNAAIETIESYVHKDNQSQLKMLPLMEVVLAMTFVVVTLSVFKSIEVSFLLNDLQKQLERELENRRCFK